MLLFRSEEHLDRWLGAHPELQGARSTPSQMWELAKGWYGRRLAPDWRRATIDEAQGIFERVGLTGPFWQLPRPAA